MSSGQARAATRPADSQQPAAGTEKLLGIGEAAAKTGVSERALRYYQQLGLLTPCGCTPGGLRRYSDADLDRVDRIRQLQNLLGLNLDEISVVLRGEDRMNQIRQAYHQEDASDAERRELVTESLELQQHLRGTVESKRQAIEGFLADLDARITRTREFLSQMTESAASPAGDPR
jgi:MerR family transcriptional regulator, repressor of the yfmOP operon